jgi:hypothetical protein
LRSNALTGLSPGQLLVLTGRVREVIGDVVKPGGRPPAAGLYRSVVMVVHLMRRNPVQAVAAEVFGVSQATVSRRWDLLRPIIRRVLAASVPHPVEIVGGSTLLVDGTIAPTWDWRHISDLYSTKHATAGMNIQLAATLDGRLAAVGPKAVHGARHDAHAFGASGLKDLVAGLHAGADLGYVGVEGIDIIPYKRAAGCDLRELDTAFNLDFSGIRAAVERAVATFKTWRMLSKEGGRYRPPIDKFEETLNAITGLMSLAAYE